MFRILLNADETPIVLALSKNPGHERVRVEKNYPSSLTSGSYDASSRIADLRGCLTIL